MKSKIGEHSKKESRLKKLLYTRLQRSSQPPSMVLFLIKNKIARSEKEARGLLLSIIVIILLISFLLFAKCIIEPIFITNIK